MGIKNLTKLLKELDSFNKDDSYSKILKKTDLKNYKNKKVAIDASIMIYQIIIANRNTGKDKVDIDGNLISHKIGLFNKILTLLNFNIIPVFVFDGKPPDIKQNIIQSRKESKDTAQKKKELAETEEEKIKWFKRDFVITSDIINDCQELLTDMGIPWVQSKGEADILCAELNKKKYVDFVSTEDTDILTFGGQKIVRHLISNKNQTIELNIKDILINLEITYDQFITLCICLGCDYCPKIIYDSPYDLFVNLQEANMDVNKFVEKNKKFKIPSDFINEFKETYNYFKCIDNISEKKNELKYLDTSINNNIDLKFNIRLPNTDNLFKNLIQKSNMNKRNIKNKIDTLTKYHNCKNELKQKSNYKNKFKNSNSNRNSSTKSQNNTNSTNSYINSCNNNTNKNSDKTFNIIEMLKNNLHFSNIT